jgi:small subunit ribosomal protein S20
VANIKSQIKRNKQNEKKRLRNKAVKSELKTRIKTVKNLAVSSNDPEETNKALQLAIKRLDQAAAKGIIHKNQAANRKSKLVKAIVRSASSASG